MYRGACQQDTLHETGELDTTEQLTQQQGQPLRTAVEYVTSKSANGEESHKRKKYNLKENNKGTKKT